MRALLGSTLIGAWLLAGAGLPAVAAAAAPSSSSGGDAITVMTFNLRYGTADDGPNAWEHRHELVAAVIANAAPTILGTQECLAFQRDFLHDVLPGHAVVAAGRDDGGEAGEMCALFVDAGRFDVLASGHFWLSPTPAVAGSRGWDAALPRIATWARLGDRQAGGRQFLVVNTHWDHVGEQARRESARLIRAQAAALAPDLPWLVMGDLNTPIEADAPDAPGRLLREGDGEGVVLLDTFAEAPTGIGSFHGFTGKPERGRIDAILATADFAPRAAALIDTSVGGVWPSDHFPLTAVVRLVR